LLQYFLPFSDRFQPIYRDAGDHDPPEDGSGVERGSSHEADRQLRLGDIGRVQDRGGAGHQRPLHQVPQEARHPPQLPLRHAAASFRFM
jgi:hypothetical protein